MSSRTDIKFLGRWGISLAQLVPTLTLILVLCAFALGYPQFLAIGNLQTIVLQVAPLLVLGVGVTFVILIGSIDLSIGSVMAVGGVAGATLIDSIGYLAFPAAIGIGALAGLLNGLLVTKARIPSFIVTLCSLGFWLAVAYTLSGGPPVSVSVENFYYFGWLSDYVGPVPLVGIVSCIALLAAYFLERYTRFGRYALAIGANEETSRLSGIPVDRYKILVFAFCGAYAAFAGLVLLGVNSGGAAPRGGEPFLLLAIAAVIVGGTALTGGSGSVLRTLVGSLILAIVVNGMTIAGVDPLAQRAATGAMIIVAAALTLDRRSLATVK